MNISESILLILVASLLLFAFIWNMFSFLIFGDFANFNQREMLTKELLSSCRLNSLCDYIIHCSNGSFSVSGGALDLGKWSYTSNKGLRLQIMRGTELHRKLENTLEGLLKAKVG